MHLRSAAPARFVTRSAVKLQVIVSHVGALSEMLRNFGREDQIDKAAIDRLAG